MPQLWLAVVVGLTGASSCRGPSTSRTNTTPPAMATCGDGHIDEGEQCDGSDLGAATCSSLGFDQGTLSCKADCQYGTSLCVKRCGNGRIDADEQCDGALGIEACASFGFNRCTDACAVDTARCILTPYELGPQLDLAKGGPVALADAPPIGTADAVVAVPSLGRVELIPWVTPNGFQASQGRKLSFQTSPKRATAVDVDADGIPEVLAINDDGSIDVSFFQGATFRPTTALDGGCADGTFIANELGRAVAQCGTDAVVLGAATPQRIHRQGISSWGASTGLIGVGAGAAVLLTPPAYADDVTPTFTGSPLEVAAADFDADGDVDVAIVEVGGVRVLENTGPALVERASFPSVGAHALEARDVDLDRRPDVVWAAGNDLVVRRNRSTFLFSEFRLPVGPGTQLFVSWGDADGDGDVDAATTFSNGADATRTVLFRNRLR